MIRWDWWRSVGDGNVEADCGKFMRKVIGVVGVERNVVRSR